MTEKKNIVSVIVAVYNAEKYLKECMDSIINQTLKDIEIICVNDGSTDNSSNILEDYKKQDKRIHIITKENEGLGGASARNTGLEYASGKYVSILDSDDFFELDMLEKVVERAEKFNSDIVVFGGKEYDEKNGNIYKVASILNEGEIPKKDVFSYKDCASGIFQLSQGMAWNKLFSKSFLDKHGIKFQHVKYTDDAYFTFANMVLAERICVLKEYLCYYRVNTGISQTDGLANYPDSSYSPYVLLKESLCTWGIYESVKNSFINCATTFMRYFYDKINRCDSYEYLHNKLRSEIFEILGISSLSKDDFRDERVYLWVNQVLNNSASELVFKASRSFGNDSTTGILRFQFPYDKIPRESKIAIIGAGIMGRHYYSQVMLSGYCDVVIWAEQENPFELSYIKTLDDLDNSSFDYALVAYFQPRLIKPVLKKLDEMGIPQDNIIIGGNI